MFNRFQLLLVFGAVALAFFLVNHQNELIFVMVNIFNVGIIVFYDGWKILVY